MYIHIYIVWRNWFMYIYIYTHDIYTYIHFFRYSIFACGHRKRQQSKPAQGLTRKMHNSEGTTSGSLKTTIFQRSNPLYFATKLKAKGGWWGQLSNTTGDLRNIFKHGDMVGETWNTHIYIYMQFIYTLLIK